MYTRVPDVSKIKIKMNHSSFLMDFTSPIYEYNETYKSLVLFYLFRLNSIIMILSYLNIHRKLIMCHSFFVPKILIKFFESSTV